MLLLFLFNSGLHILSSLVSFFHLTFCIANMDDRYAIATGKTYSYILQFAISLGQLYGSAFYYITAILEGDNFSVNSFYYYAYYIGANASWIVIPSIVGIRCWGKICEAFRIQGGQTKKPKVRWCRPFQVIGFKDSELIMMFSAVWWLFVKELVESLLKLPCLEIGRASCRERV